MEEKKSSYTGFTEARKKANEKYMGKFVEIKVRVIPEDKDAIQAHAAKMKESTNSFIKRAIDETMEADSHIIRPAADSKK